MTSLKRFVGRLSRADSSGFSVSVQTFGVNLAVLFINVLTGVITARVLGPVGRGEQEALMLWPVFLARAFTLGLPSAFVFHLRRDPGAARSLVSAGFLAAPAAGLLATLAGISFLPYWLTEYDVDIVRLAQVFMLFTPIILTEELCVAALLARDEFRLFNKVRIIRPVAALMLLVTLALLGTLTPALAVLAYIAPTLPITAFLSSFLWRAYRPARFPSWRSLRRPFAQLFSYGLRSYGNELTAALSENLGRALVVGMLTPSNMGLFVVSLSLARMLNVFQFAVVTVLFPRASGQPLGTVMEMTGRAVRVSTAVTCVAALTLGALGPFALTLLYSAEFSEGATLMRLLIAETVINGVIVVLIQALMATDRPGVATLLQSVGVAASVPLLLLLVPLLGLSGAGVALLMSAVLRLAFALASFPLFLGVPAPSLLMRWDDFRVLKEKWLEGSV